MTLKRTVSLVFIVFLLSAAQSVLAAKCNDAEKGMGCFDRYDGAQDSFSCDCSKAPGASEGAGAAEAEAGAEAAAVPVAGSEGRCTAAQKAAKCNTRYDAAQDSFSCECK